MLLPDFKVFPRIGRVLGIDWGARRTGVAVSDPSRTFIFVRAPIVVRSDNESIAQKIAEIANSEQVVGIVVGLPLRGDGSDSETTVAVRNMVVELVSQTDLPICFIDENLTSSAAQEQMGRVKREDIKQKLDSESARIILENAIALINRQNCEN